MNTRQIHSLVFLESVDEARSFLKNFEKTVRLAPADFKIISFHPTVKAFLLEHNMTVRESFHFCPPESHRQLLVVLEQFAQQVRERCRIEDKFGVEQSYVENLLYPLLPTMAHWLYQIEVMHKTIERYRPQELVTAGLPSANVSRSIWLEDSERFLSFIAARMGKGFKVPSRSIPMPVPRQRLQEALDVSLGAARLLTAKLLFSDPLKKELILVSSSGHGMTAVIADLAGELGDGYDIGMLDLPVRQAFQEYGQRLFHQKDQAYRYMPSHTHAPTRPDANFCRQRDEFERNFMGIINQWQYRGVKPFPWLKQKYERAFRPLIIDATYQQSAQLNQYLDEYRPAAVLSPYARGKTAVLGELCAMKGIPSVMIPHGSFCAVSDPYSKIDWLESARGVVNTPYQYLACQTRLLEGFLSDVPVKSKLLTTGPLILGRPCAGRKRDGKQGERIILHAGTPKYRRCMRFLNYETLEEYVDGIVPLIEAVDRMEGVHLLIRYRPIDGLSTPIFQRLLPASDAYTVVSSGSFADTLARADLLVSYSSSTIEEALQSDVPVLLWNKYGRYQHIQGEVLQPERALTPAAVYNVNSPDHLSFALDWIDRNHLSRPQDWSYLFEKYRYGTDERIALSAFLRGLNKQEPVTFLDKELVR